MPVERKAWACQYGCRTNVQTVRKRMEKHEERCWCNPARRACATCLHLKHEWETVYERPNVDHEERFAYCDADEDIDLSEKLRHDCPLWENVSGEGSNEG